MQATEIYRADIEALPGVLRTLLEAELSAGNEIVEVGHSFPAPPAGACFRLAQPLRTRARKSGDGIDYHDRDCPGYSGEITDAKRFYFLLEPPHAPPGQGSGGDAPGVFRPSAAPSPEQADVVLFRRFEASMVMNFEKWHDGIGYDLGAVRGMSPQGRRAVGELLIARGLRDWRDVEALACCDSPEARAALEAAMDGASHEIRNAVAAHASHLVSNSMRTASLVRGLDGADFFGGLSQTLDQVAVFHPPPVVDALLRGTLDRAGDVAVHFAAMLCYIHGCAPEPFDFEQRPFFFQFDAVQAADRQRAFAELCRKISIDPAPYLGGVKQTVPAAVPPEYTVEVDHRGEMLTYCEPNRSAHVTCTFGGAPCIVSSTLSSWHYPLGRRSEKMDDEERKTILARIAGYCRTHYRMGNLSFEE